MTISGTSGNDHLTGTVGDDTFDLSQGGNDTAFGGVGDDLFLMGGAFNVKDKIDGGDGIDTVELDGDYSHLLAFAATTMTNVENVVVDAGHSYKLTTVDANIDSTTLATSAFTFDASALGVGDNATFNAAAETDTQLIFYGGAGINKFTGGALTDHIHLGLGDDDVHGGAGDDVIVATGNGALTASDRIDGGGSGFNTLQLDGDQKVKFGAHTLQNIQFVDGYGGHYVLTMNDGNVAAGGYLPFDFSVTPASSSLHFNGTAETDGRFNVFGTEGKDVITGGMGNDRFGGLLGADVLTGGAGNDIFVYIAVAESTGVARDHITDLTVGSDTIDLDVAVAHIDAQVATGQLDKAHFNGELHTALKGNLQAHHAVLFTPDAGTLAGHTFLIVDANGQAGYQADADYVFDVTGGTNLNALSTSDFF